MIESGLIKSISIFRLQQGNASRDYQPHKLHVTDFFLSSVVYVAVTSIDWYNYLVPQNREDVNFWQSPEVIKYSGIISRSTIVFQT